MLEIFSLFFCFLSFTYKAHCVLWQWIVIDWLGILQKWIHHCPVTECPRTKFRSRSYDSKPSVAPRTPVSWLEKPRSLSYVCQTHALGFKAGSSGCGDCGAAVQRACEKMAANRPINTYCHGMSGRRYVLSSAFTYRNGAGCAASDSRQRYIENLLATILW